LIAPVLSNDITVTINSFFPQFRRKSYENEPYTIDRDDFGSASSGTPRAAARRGYGASGARRADRQRQNARREHGDGAVGRKP
jgi:hypothetical protein